jgi:hypothetical protein
MRSISDSRIEDIYSSNAIDTTINSNTVFSCRIYKMQVIAVNKMIKNKDIITPDNFYIKNVYHLPHVKGIIYEEYNNVLHFITILDSRNLKTREAIYEVEFQVYNIFKNRYFDFLTLYFNSLDEINEFLRGKEQHILYYSRI